MKIGRAASGIKGTISRVIKDRIFRIGARFDGRMSAVKAEIGKHVPIANFREGARGEHLPENSAQHPIQRGDSNRFCEAFQKQPGCVMPEKEQTVQERHQEVLETQPRNSHNSKGSPNEAIATCQRTWHIHTQREIHVSAVAWLSVRPTIRQHHTRYLRKLQMMPIWLLKQNIVSRAIESVRREAVSAGWKPPTTEKEPLPMADTPRDLPFQREEGRGCLPRRDPIWPAAIATMKRMVREHVAEPQAPVS